MPHELDLLSSSPNASFSSSTSSLSSTTPSCSASTIHKSDTQSTSLCLDLSEVHTDNKADVHGLRYPPGFLPALPVLHPPVSPPPSSSASLPPSDEAEHAGPAPIRALSAPQFAALHEQYLTTHAPDSVLFPFLHGLEGDNDAQTAFFVPSPHGGVRVPRFRGLVWVASDEDDVAAYEASLDEYTDEEEDDYSTSEEDDAAPRDELGMEIDVEVVGMDVDADDADAKRAREEGPHMHPVQQRPSLSAIDTGGGKEHKHRLSNASSTSSYSSDAPSPLLDTPAVETPLTPPEDKDCVMQDDIVVERGERERVLLTSTFTPRELLCVDRETGETRFVEPKVPDGISLRNFGIQVPIFATLSDIVVYSPRGNTKAALAVAAHFAHAVEAKRVQRAARGQEDLLFYNVFVLCATPEELAKEAPHVVSRMADEVVYDGDAKIVAGNAHQAHTQGTDAQTARETHVLEPRGTQPPPEHAAPTTVLKANTISFAQREKDEMRELTQASEILTLPLDDGAAAFGGSTTQSRWDASRGQVFLGNASDARPFVPAGRRCVDEWDYGSNDPADGLGYDVCIECDDMAPFPGQAHMRAVEEHVARLERRWMDRCLREFNDKTARGESVGEDEAVPLRPPPAAGLVVHIPFPSSVAYASNGVAPFVAWLETLLRPAERVTYGMLKEREAAEGAARRWDAKPLARRSTNAATIGHSYHGGTFGGPSSLPPPSAFPSFLPSPGTTTYTRMRSTSATCLPPPAAPVQVPARTRPLKVLVFSADGYTESSALALCTLMALRRLTLPQAYLALQNEKRRSFFVYPTELAPLRRVEARLAPNNRQRRPAAVSMSFVEEKEREMEKEKEVEKEKERDGGRPRASTLPPTLGDHQVWFNDPRFDGSFPSRVLPFLYLGNLNHAANAYMLHALGITHVVSVGECALVPPEHCAGVFPAGYVPTAKPGSLWIEEREGRIRVLDIKGVCDDGIDSLEPQLGPICDWIDDARRAGGKVLVHCRVGVSRSATVTIAYVMKHLNMPLVDAYLVVRSRRLSVLIQPNMRLLYNLLGWEVRLAQERAAGDVKRLRAELARCLNWPYLAKEVHALNEKYLRPPA